MSSTLVIHAAGGGGISSINEAGALIDNLGEGFCKVKYHYIDSSRANIDKIEPKGEFYQITALANAGDGIDGSGSERRMHAVDIVENVKKYLDTNKYFEKVNGEYHIVCASASGATGAVSSAMIIKHLVMRNIPTVALIIGDSSNLLYTKNTINSLASLDNIAKQTKKAISVTYINNHSLLNKTQGLAGAEKAANEHIGNILTSLSLFLSGQNEALDSQDMINILMPTNYQQIKVQPGLYGLMFFAQDIQPIDGAIPVVGRSLTTYGNDFDTNIPLLHHKRGYITSTSAIGIIKEDNLPLHMISFANYFTTEQKNLNDLKQNYENIASNITNESLAGCEDGQLDDSGLIL